MANFVRAGGDVVQARDAFNQNPPYIPSLPRHVYLKHTNKQVQKGGADPFFPAICIPVTDSSTLAPAITKTGPTDGSTIVLRAGREVSILSGVFAMWPQVPRGHIADAMRNGFLEVHEDYLGGSRKLTIAQMMAYVATDAPWTTYVLSRTKTGVVNDADPTVNVEGTIAIEFNKLHGILLFNGGAGPTATVTAWHREVGEPGEPRGPWIKGEQFLLTADSQELQISNGYREVYIQLTTIAGAPASVDVKLSGMA